MLMLVAWIVIGLCTTVFITETAFMVVVTAKKLREMGLLEGELKWVAGFWLAIGWPCDCLMNWWRGSWMFREWPRKKTFSARIQWHVDHLAQSKEPLKALHWGRVLNVDPEHIDMPDEEK